MSASSRSLRAAAAAIVLGFSLAAPLTAQQGGPPPAGARPGAGQGPRQGQGPGRMSVDARVQRMTAELGLSTEQATRLRAAFTAEQRTADSIFARRAAAMDAERTAMTAMHSNTQKAVSGILTADQKLKHDAMRGRMAMRGGPDGGMRRGGRDGMRRNDGRGRNDRRGMMRGPRPDVPPPSEGSTNR